MEKLEDYLHCGDIWCMNCGKRVEYKLLSLISDLAGYTAKLHGLKCSVVNPFALVEEMNCCEKPNYTCNGLKPEDYVDVENYCEEV